MYTYIYIYIYICWWYIYFVSRFSWPFVKCKLASLPRMWPTWDAWRTEELPVPIPEASLTSGQSNAHEYVEVFAHHNFWFESKLFRWQSMIINPSCTVSTSATRSCQEMDSAPARGQKLSQALINDSAKKTSIISAFGERLFSNRLWPSPAHKYTCGMSWHISMPWTPRLWLKHLNPGIFPSAHPLPQHVITLDVQRLIQ